MIELNDDSLKFRFPEVYPGAELEITFQRTLRIPDDDTDYPLPPGLGSFPLRHVDDFGAGLPENWLERGGVMMPMYQSEAMWLNFNSADITRRGEYPFLIKMAAGKINAVTGEGWTDGVNRDPQDYMVVPDQPWLDGYCVEKGLIRQFVAMPLGSGYSAEEQLTGEAEFGGVQIEVYPMKREAFERRFPEVKHHDEKYSLHPCLSSPLACAPMGLGAGGRMRQEIEEDPYDLADWDLRNSSRCFVHLTNSLVWRAITGDEPPTTPPTATEYAQAGLPWFEYYSDGKAVEGGERLGHVKSVAQLGKEKGEVPLPENQSVTPARIIALREGLTTGQVREW